MSDFLNSLQNAVFNGVPFKVRRETTAVGRKLAIHDYPFRDGVWPEDLGRKPRQFEFEGYLIGDDAPALAALLVAMAETQAPGFLVHPTVGGLLVALLNCATSVRWDEQRVIGLQLAFIEASDPLFASTIISTVIETLTFADSASSAAGSDFHADVDPLLGDNPAITDEATAVVTNFGDQCLSATTDAAAAFTAVATLPGDFGRYAAAAAGTAAPADATVQSLLADAVTARAALEDAIAAATAAANALAASTDIMGLLTPIASAMAATTANPGDQVNVLGKVAGFAYRDAAGGAGLSGNIAKARDAMSAACRRAALIAMARASSSYQPTSYQDAVALRDTLVTALTAEIVISADAGQDAIYLALYQLRSAVIADLTARGGDLARVETVSLNAVLPANVIAYARYRDSSRADELVRRVNPMHPGFMPTTFEALSR